MSESSLVSRIINLRESKDWSQAELARRLGIEKSVMNKIENGTRKVQTNELIKLSSLFDVSVDFLLNGNEKSHYDVPSWASQEDVLEIESIIEKNARMTYAGKELDEDEIENIRQVVRATLWKRLQKKKESGANE